MIGADGRIRYVTDFHDAKRRVEQLTAEQVLGVDIETAPKPDFAQDPSAALDPYRADVRLVSVATLDGRVAVFDLYRLPIEALRPLTARPWAVFNGSFEYRHLNRAGLTVPPLHDVQLLDRLTSHRMHRKLSDSVQDALGIEMDKTEQTSDWSAPELSQQQIEYVGLDALLTVRAAAALKRRLALTGQRRLYDVWRAALPVLAALQLRGQTFDWTAHQQLVVHWTREREQLLIELKAHLGAAVNPNSGPQLGEWLQQHVSAAVLTYWPKTPTGRLKTDNDTFALFADLPLVQPLLRYKAVAKLLSTYGTKYDKHRHPVTGRLHPEFQLGQTTSGRICAARPNTQNPPRLAEFRALFVPAPGRVLIGADYSQIELRVAALLSNDAVMLSAYQHGEDLHRLTAAAVAGVAPEQVTKEQRTAAKAVNFGNLYGQGAAGLAKTAQITYGVSMTAEQAQAALSQFHQTYPALARWKHQQVKLAQRSRRVATRLGLIRDFDIQGVGFLKGEAQNIPVQGSAAEVLACTLARLPSALKGIDAQLYHNIHDELLLDVSPGYAEPAGAALQQAMVAGFLDVFPNGEALVADLVDVQHGSSWAEVH